MKKNIQKSHILLSEGGADVKGELKKLPDQQVGEL
jgi:hypothetical protein